MDVARLEAEPVHGRQMPDRIARVAVHHQLRPRRRARGEIEQHRIVGPRRPVRLERGRSGSSAYRKRASRRASRRPRCARARLSRRRTSPRPARGRRGISPCRARAGRQCRPRTSCGIAGMSTRPSFIAASIVTHSSGVTPSIIRSRSPRFAPIERRPLASCDDCCESSAKVRVSTVSPITFSATFCAVVAGRQFGVEPVERPVEPLRPRPDEGRRGGDVLVAELKQEIARRAERRRRGASELLREDGGHGVEDVGHGQVWLRRHYDNSLFFTK